jgi:hypothetical protein
MAANGNPNERPKVEGQSAPLSGTGGATAGDQVVPPERPHRSSGKTAGDVATPLQPGGTLPSGGPGAGIGSIGTGGGNTAGGATGSQKRSGG